MIRKAMSWKRAGRTLWETTFMSALIIGGQYALGNTVAPHEWAIIIAVAALVSLLNPFGA